MHDTADDAAIIRPLDPAHIRRQMRFDPLPLLIAKPKQVPGHDPNPLPKTNQDRIVRAEKLMSSDPSFVSLRFAEQFHKQTYKRDKLQCALGIIVDETMSAGIPETGDRT